MAPAQPSGITPRLRVPSMPRRFAKDRARRIEAIRAAAPKYINPAPSSQPTATSRPVPGPQNETSQSMASSPRATPPKVVKLAQKQMGRLLIAATKKPGLQTFTPYRPRRLEKHLDVNRRNIAATVLAPFQSQSQVLDDAGGGESENLAYQQSSLVNGQQTPNDTSRGKKTLQEPALFQDAALLQRMAASHPQQLNTSRPHRDSGTQAHSNKSSNDQIKQQASPTVNSCLCLVATVSGLSKSIHRASNTCPSAPSPHITSRGSSIAVPVDIYDLPPDPDNDSVDGVANPTPRNGKASSAFALAGENNSIAGVHALGVKVRAKKPTMPQAKTYSKKLAGQSSQQNMILEPPQATQHPEAHPGEDEMPVLRRLPLRTSPQASTRVDKAKKSRAKTKKKSPRRLPVGVLKIVPERLRNVYSGSSEGEVEPAELCDDLISLGSPREAHKTHKSHRSRAPTKKKLLPKSRLRTDTPDSSAYRMPTHRINFKINVSHLPPYRDGFEGKEAYPMGKPLCVRKSPRQRDSMHKMAVKFGILPLGSEKYAQGGVQKEARKVRRPCEKHRDPYVEPKYQGLSDGDQRNDILIVRRLKDISVEQHAVQLPPRRYVQDSFQEEVRHDSEQPTNRKHDETSHPIVLNNMQQPGAHHVHELMHICYEEDDVFGPEQNSERTNHPMPANEPEPEPEPDVEANESTNNNNAAQLHDHKESYKNMRLSSLHLPTPSMSQKRTAEEIPIDKTPTRPSAHNSNVSPPPRKYTRLDNASDCGYSEEEEEEEEERRDGEAGTDSAEEDFNEFNMQNIAPSSSAGRRFSSISTKTDIDGIARRLKLVPISHLVNDVEKNDIDEEEFPRNMSNQSGSMDSLSDGEPGGTSDASDAESDSRSIGGEEMDMNEVHHDEQDETALGEEEELKYGSDEIVLENEGTACYERSPSVRTPQPSLHVKFGDVQYEPSYEPRIFDEHDSEYLDGFNSLLDTHQEVNSQQSEDEFENCRLRILQDALPGNITSPFDDFGARNFPGKWLPANGGPSQYATSISSQRTASSEKPNQRANNTNTQNYGTQDEVWKLRVPDSSSFSMEVDDEIVECQSPARQPRTRSSSFRRSSSRFASRTPSLNIIQRKPSPDLGEPVVDYSNNTQGSVDLGKDVETTTRRRISSTREIPETQYEYPTETPESQLSFVPQESVMDYFERAARNLHTHTPIQRSRSSTQSAPEHTASTSPIQINLSASSTCGLQYYPQRSLLSSVRTPRKLPALMGASPGQGKELQRLTRQTSQNFGTTFHTRKTRVVSLPFQPKFKEIAG